MGKIQNLLCFCLLSSPLLSQNVIDIETDRPDQTECSSVIPVKTVQIETGILQQQDSGIHTLFVPTTLIRIGIFRTLEIRVIGGEYYAPLTGGNSKNEGFSPFSLGSKVYIGEEKKLRPQTSLLFHFKHNPSRFSFKTVTFDFRFSMSHTLSERVDFGYNLGGVLEPTTGDLAWIYTVTTAVSITRKLGAYIETFGGIANNTLPTHQFDGGLTYLLLRNLQLDCSAGVGLNENSPDNYLSAGISWRIPK